MDDLISRQAAIEALKRAEALTRAFGYHNVIETIRDLPSAQPERKTGRWIAHVGCKFVGFPYMHYECDQCGAFKPTETNFCPDCGADMRGDTDEAY